jgi:hypothetical protein
MAQDGFGPVGGEYDIVGAIPGDQTRAQVAVGPNGGYVVWQDNTSDGDGLGIAARRLDGTLSATLSTFRVNAKSAGDQENAQLAITKQGGAVFVWQGGANQLAAIFARVLLADGTFAGEEIQVNTHSNGLQTSPAVAVLNDGGIVVVWTSVGQDGSMAGVYGQRLSPSGAKVGSEFRINVSTQLNQRNPAVVALAGGGFAVAWVSEKQKSVVHATDEKGQLAEASSGAPIYDVGIYAGLYHASGQVARAEFRLDQGLNICATPALAASGTGGFTGVWGEQPGPLSGQGAAAPVGWDICARTFAASGEATSAGSRLNSHTYGDQLYPRIAGLAGQHMAVWTSMGQDGSFEGVYQRMIDPSNGALLGSETQVNSTIRGPQVYPSVAADGGNRFVAIWSGFVSAVAGYDLYGQRYATVDLLPLPDRPYVSALSQSKLSVTWPVLAGYTGVRYELLVDSASEPVVVEGNSFVVAQLSAGSSHTIKLAYRLSDGRRSSFSESTTGKTWSDDENFDGLPDDWQSGFWGANRAKWAAASLDSDGDGASNIQEFLAGTNPLEEKSVLSLQIVPGGQGSLVQWNTQPGSIYQVQMTSDFTTWADASGLRLATGATDSIPAVGDAGVSYYRVVRQR